jgi:hypothetical protein
MKKRELKALAEKAGYVLGMMIVPKKCYTLTNLTTRKKYRMMVRTHDLVRILNIEAKRKMGEKV